MPVHLTPRIILFFGVLAHIRRATLHSLTSLCGFSVRPLARLPRQESPKGARGFRCYPLGRKLGGSKVSPFTEERKEGKSCAPRGLCETCRSPDQASRRRDVVGNFACITSSLEIQWPTGLRGIAGRRSTSRMAVHVPFHVRSGCRSNNRGSSSRIE